MSSEDEEPSTSSSSPPSIPAPASTLHFVLCYDYQHQLFNRNDRAQFVTRFHGPFYSQEAATACFNSLTKFPRVHIQADYDFSRRTDVFSRLHAPTEDADEGTETGFAPFASEFSETYWGEAFPEALLADRQRTWRDFPENTPRFWRTMLRVTDGRCAILSDKCVEIRELIRYFGQEEDYIRGFLPNHVFRHSYPPCVPRLTRSTEYDNSETVNDPTMKFGRIRAKLTASRFHIMTTSKLRMLRGPGPDSIRSIVVPFFEVRFGLTAEMALASCGASLLDGVASWGKTISHTHKLHLMQAAANLPDVMGEEEESESSNSLFMLHSVRAVAAFLERIVERRKMLRNAPRIKTAVIGTGVLFVPYLVDVLQSVFLPSQFLVRVQNREEAFQIVQGAKEHGIDCYAMVSYDGSVSQDSAIAWIKLKSVPRLWLDLLVEFGVTGVVFAACTRSNLRGAAEGGCSNQILRGELEMWVTLIAGGELHLPRTFGEKPSQPWRSMDDWESGIREEDMLRMAVQLLNLDFEVWRIFASSSETLYRLAFLLTFQRFRRKFESFPKAIAIRPYGVVHPASERLAGAVCCPYFQKDFHRSALRSVLERILRGPLQILAMEALPLAVDERLDGEDKVKLMFYQTEEKGLFYFIDWETKERFPLRDLMQQQEDLLRKAVVKLWSQVCKHVCYELGNDGAKAALLNWCPVCDFEGAEHLEDVVVEEAGPGEEVVQETEDEGEFPPSISIREVCEWIDPAEHVGHWMTAFHVERLGLDVICMPVGELLPHQRSVNSMTQSGSRRVVPRSPQ